MIEADDFGIIPATLELGLLLESRDWASQQNKYMQRSSPIPLPARS